MYLFSNADGFSFKLKTGPLGGEMLSNRGPPRGVKSSGYGTAPKTRETSVVMAATRARSASASTSSSPRGTVTADLNPDTGKLVVRYPGPIEDELQEAIRSLTELPVDELRRLYQSYYGHRITLRSKESLARAVARKAVQTHSRVNAHSDYPSYEETEPSSRRGAVAIDCRPQSAGGSPGAGTGRRLNTGGSDLLSPYQQREYHQHCTDDMFYDGMPHRPRTAHVPVRSVEPQYTRSERDGGARWFERCVREMGINTDLPEELIQQRKNAYTGEGTIEWAERLERMASKLLSRYQARLCKKTSGESRAEHSSSASTRTVDEERQVATAEWRLHRGIERGPVYLFQVWTGIKKAVLDFEYNGTYKVYSPGMFLKVLEERKRFLEKVKRVRRLNRLDASQTSQEAIDIGQAVEALQEGGFGESNDEEDVPFVSVNVDHNNILQLSVYFGRAQLESALPAAAASQYAFKVEAAAIAVDKWIGLTGPWKNKILHFSREPPASPSLSKNASLLQSQGRPLHRRASLGGTLGSTVGGDDFNATARPVPPPSGTSGPGGDSEPGLIDAFFVDGLCFEKWYTEKTCNPSDPFQCVRCGSKRLGNNFIYPGGADLQRGRYHCFVCKKKVLHLSMSTHERKVRPRWNPTSSRMKLEHSSLNDPPH